MKGKAFVSKTEEKHDHGMWDIRKNYKRRALSEIRSFYTNMHPLNTWLF